MKEVITKNKIIAIKKGSTLIISDGDDIREVKLEHDAFAKIDYTDTIIVTEQKTVFPKKDNKTELTLLT